jgi:hypothetical protein
LTNGHIKKEEVKNRQRKYKDIEEMRPEETYKYLEIPQKQQVDHSCLKKIFTEKDRKSHKNVEQQVICENQITALNIWASHVLTYSDGIIKGLTQMVRAMTDLQEDYLLNSLSSSLIHL